MEGKTNENKKGKGREKACFRILVCKGIVSMFFKMFASNTIKFQHHQTPIVTFHRLEC